ncbi:MAG: helix-turn-helix domain-containing protein [Clostridiales bacterium]|nr:helix-turn-helix domain-containing protein [Clostridiales bacterium]
MKVTTSSRLIQIMNERNLKQVDIINMCEPFCNKYGVKLSKNYLSQYVSGKVEPSQRTLSILGMALNVSEAWLMGYNVPKERESIVVKAFSGGLNVDTSVDNREIVLMQYYDKLNSLGKDKLIERAEELSMISKYSENYLQPIAAHERTDTKHTEEGRKHDDDLMNDESIWGD